MRTEGNFIPHCDYNDCDLGTFQYTCPNCNKENNDYDVWWKQDDILTKIVDDFNCEKCNVSLSVEWDKEEVQYYVTK